MLRPLLLLLSTARVASLCGAQQTLPTWTVDPTPILAVGREGVTAEEFAGVGGAFLLSGGRIAVGNGSPVEIRLFDDSGHFLRSFGRAGGGPAEFQRLSWLAHDGDTVFVFDFSQQRITVALLARDPRLLSTLRVTATGDRGRFDVEGRLDDGRWLVVTPVSPGWDMPPGVHRLMQSVGTIEPDAAGKVSWLGEFPGPSIFINRPGSGLAGAAVGPIAFSPWFMATASGSTLWLGDTAGDSLMAFATNGQRRPTAHLPLPGRAPEQAMIDSMRSEELAHARDEGSRSFTRARYSGERLPKFLPFFETLVPGPDGEVWVQEYTPRRSEPARYLVVGADGTPRAWIALPAGVRVSDVANDRLVGIHVDDDGVETIQVLHYSRK